MNTTAAPTSRGGRKARVTAPDPNKPQGTSSSSPTVSPESGTRRVSVIKKKAASSSTKRKSPINISNSVSASGDSGTAAVPLVPLCGKNLRWTAVALARKMREEVHRPSSVVCDEVAADAAAEARAAHPGRDVSAVERNTRRRVYDALKVMCALGCIRRREDKYLDWVGLQAISPSFSPNEGSAESFESTELRKSICRKRKKARELGAALAAFDELKKRNDNNNDNSVNGTGTGEENGNRIRFPFILVVGKPVAQDISSNAVTFEYVQPVDVYTETAIVQMLPSRSKGGSRGGGPRKRPRSPIERPVTNRPRVLAPPLILSTPSNPVKNEPEMSMSMSVSSIGIISPQFGTPRKAFMSKGLFLGSPRTPALSLGSPSPGKSMSMSFVSPMKLPKMPKNDMSTIGANWSMHIDEDDTNGSDDLGDLRCLDEADFEDEIHINDNNNTRSSSVLPSPTATARNETRRAHCEDGRRFTHH